MKRVPSSPPNIEPLPLQEGGPSWSVMIPVYNCSQFLPETLISVLEEGFPEQEMQIEVIDDASTDADIKSMVEAIGKGRVRYFRQSENVGSLRNFETCINRSTGKLVHILHGDDKIRSGYYKAIASLFERYPAAGAAFCRFSAIDEHGIENQIQKSEMQQEGILQNWLLQIAERQRIQYAAITVRREVYEKIGGFYGLTYGEDWEMWVRIARYYPVAYTPNVLAEYRRHSNSISGSKFITGQNLKDIALAIDLIQNHIPEQHKKPTLQKSKVYYGNYGIKTANHVWRRFRDIQIVNVQIREALNISKSPTVFLSIARLYLKIVLDKSLKLLPERFYKVIFKY